MTHHPHVHMIVTGGGISPDGSRWIASRPDYLVPVEVLSSLFRGRMLGMLTKAHAEGRLEFFGSFGALAGSESSQVRGPNHPRSSRTDLPTFDVTPAEHSQCRPRTRLVASGRNSCNAQAHSSHRNLGDHRAPGWRDHPCSPALARWQSYGAAGEAAA